MGNLSTATAGKNCDGRGEETCVELELAAMAGDGELIKNPPVSTQLRPLGLAWMHLRRLV